MNANLLPKSILKDVSYTYFNQAHAKLGTIITDIPLNKKSKITKLIQHRLSRYLPFFYKGCKHETLPRRSNQTPMANISN